MWIHISMANHLFSSGQLWNITTDIARYIHLFSRDCSWLHGLLPTEGSPTHATDLGCWNVGGLMELLTWVPSHVAVEKNRCPCWCSSCMLHRTPFTGNKKAAILQSDDSIAVSELALHTHHHLKPWGISTVCTVTRSQGPVVICLYVLVRNRPFV